MKLSTTKNEIVRGGVSASGEFKIKATAKAFNILSSGLYSDKIKAVIRELSCNAYDAHVAAGRPEVPFEIKMPTRLEPTFYVKDFGTGLSEQDVFNLYTTYFDSTKSDSNDYIGALGLGSKSPFSYTNSFVVESRFNGKKFIFNAFLNESGLPEIAKLSEDPTDEANGLTVMFSARAEDVEQFRTKARVALMYFNPQPKIVGWNDYKALEVHTLFEGKTWKLVDRQSADYYTRNDGPAVRQGPVIYPIDSQMLRREKVSKKLERIVDLSIDIEVPVGTVDVAASREALSYDKRTVANLIAVFEKIADEFEQTVSDSIANAKTLWEARIQLAVLTSGRDTYARTIRDMVQHEVIKPVWAGQKLTSKFNVDVSDFKSSSVLTITRSTYMKRNSVRNSSTAFADRGKHYPIEAGKHVQVFLQDIKKQAGNDVIGQYLIQQQMKNPNANNGEVQAIVVVPNTSKDVASAVKEVKELCKRLGGASFERVSSLPFTPSKKSYTYKARAKEQVWEWDGFKEAKWGGRRNSLNTTYSKLTWNTVDVDFSQGGYYVLVERFTPVCNGRSISRLDYVVNLMSELKIDKKFYAMSEKQVAAAKKEGKWIELIPALKKEIATLNANHKLTDWLAADRLQSKLNPSQLADKNNLKRLVNLIDSNKYDNELSKFIKDMNNVFQTNTPNIEQGLRQIDMYDADELDKRVDAVIDRWNTIKKTYPMLGVVSGYSFSETASVKVILDYVSSM